MTKAIRVMIVDDHEIVREGLQTLLSEEPDIEIVAQADGGRQALELVASSLPDVVLMDLVMPGMDGIAATEMLRHKAPNCQVLILTSFSEDHRVHSAIRAGAIGYVMKNVLKLDLLRAIRAAARGEPALDADAQRALMRRSSALAQPPAHSDLTGRELEVLCLVAKGYSNKEISQSLHLTEGTVKVYLSTIFDKLDVADRTQAALYAVKHGLVVD